MNDAETVLHVRGMTCGNCARHVGDAVRAVAGVRTASVDLAAGTVLIAHAPTTDLPAVKAAIEDAGYEVG
jgi:copper chaperone CopZ